MFNISYKFREGVSYRKFVRRFEIRLGQREIERRALSRPPFRPHLASMERDDAFYVGQSDAGARVLLGTVKTFEGAKKLCFVLHVEADAVICDEERPIFVLPKTNLNYFILS